jgi:hypothetical protein
MSKWITDRLPTAEDALDNLVIAWYKGEIVVWPIELVIHDMPWQPIQRPAPYVKPKRWTVEWNVDTWILLDYGLKRSYWCGLGELGRNGGDAAQRIADVFNEVLP